MSDVLKELQKFEAHCLEAKQREVAELAHNAADEIASLRARLERAREGFHRIQVNAASSKAPEVFGALASGYLRELETGGGDG